MAIVYNNKEYRNLQQQVKKNMDDILFILQEEGVLNEFGIKVVGQEASVLDMPTVADYKEDNPEWSYGDAFAIGTEEPYELYILTRANGTHPDDYWFNIGEFPAPGPQGPEGPQGEVGPQGPTGNPGTNGVSPQLGVGNVVVETLESDQDATVAITESGTQANPIWNFNFGIPKGQDGSAVTSVAWGDITGSLANQTDLVSALQAKANASALASYATQVYANNVASNATYQANVYTDSKISALSSVYMTETAVGDYLYDNEYAHIDEIPTDTSDLTNNAGFITNAALSGYATQSWVSSNFLSIGTPIGGSAVWGSISGTLANQTDLMNKFSEYAPLSSLSNYAELSVLSSYATVSALSSAISAVEAEIPDIRGLASETYVDDSISALSSVYAPIGDYATNSALSSAISGVNSTISSLNYLSVGAMSSETYIPRVGGDNDGTYWTAITLGDDTYDIPQGGGSVAWGSISGTLEDQTDLQDALDSKLDKEVTAGDDSSYIDINETAIGLYVDGLGENDEPVGSYLETSKDGVVIQANNTEGQATQLTVSDGSVTITRDSDSASIELFDLTPVSGINDGSNWTELTIGSETYSIPAGGSIPSGVYAELSGSNTFTGFNGFEGYTGFTGSVRIGSYISLAPGDARIYGSFVNGRSYINTNCNLNVSGLLSLVGDGGINMSTHGIIFYDSSVPGYSPIVNVDLSDNAYEIALPKASGTLALQSEIPSVSEYATISALSSAIDSLSSVYAPIGSYASQSDIDALSSVYAPISLVSTVSDLDYLSVGALSSGTVIPVIPASLPADGGTASAVSGYASEVWTFTLSDNTSVSKTVLVG